MDWIVSLITLTAMEIVLGIDNIVFISILCGRLPDKQRAQARQLGLGLAMVSRILLLLSITWVLGLTQPVFHLTDFGIPAKWVESDHIMVKHSAETEEAEVESGGDIHDMNAISMRDMILFLGGLFLIANSVIEIHHKVEGEHAETKNKVPPSFAGVLVQIAILDIIFSLDSVITAVGMADEIWVMICAVLISVGVMLIFAGAVERFVSANPTIKILALSFLILIGVMLVAEGVGSPVNKGYIYFAMAFSLIVEVINMQVRKRGISIIPSEH